MTSVLPTLRSNPYLGSSHIIRHRREVLLWECNGEQASTFRARTRSMNGPTQQHRSSRKAVTLTSRRAVWVKTPSPGGDILSNFGSGRLCGWLEWVSLFLHGRTCRHSKAACILWQDTMRIKRRFVRLKTCPQLRHIQLTAVSHDIDETPPSVTIRSIDVTMFDVE